MSYPINYPTPQNANVQILYKTDDWVKPQGASFVWFTLIGGGGGGAGGDPSQGISGAGGSAAVTNCMVPAFLIPDVLNVSVGAGGAGGTFGGAGGNGTATSLIYQAKDGTGYTLLTANGGSGGTIPAGSGLGGTASNSNFFSCMGFFQSLAGQTASTSNPGASATTFLSAGASIGPVDANYGYRSPGPSIGAVAIPGFFMMQPVIVGVGGSGGTGASWGNGGNGGIGCGGGAGGNYTTGVSPIGGRGGDGLAVIITW